MSFTLLYNAKVRTMDSGNPEADAVLIWKDRIIAAGHHAALESLATVKERVDLGGALLLPGLVDAHVHLGAYSERLRRVDLDGVAYMDGVLAKVSDYARTLAPGEWVLGGGYNPNLWNIRPHRSLLDSISPDVPIILNSKDFHTIWMNTAALRAVGVNAGTPDPPGGAIERDPDGTPNGILREYACKLVEGKAPEPGLQRMAETMHAGISRLHTYGLVGVHTPEGEKEFSALQCLRREKGLRFRISAMLSRNQFEPAVRMGIRDGVGDDFLQIAGLKLFVDGALGSQTGYMLEPYLGSESNRGMCVIDPGELREQVARACQNGISVAVHAIGDAANRLAIEALEGCAEEAGRFGLRNRIEHLQLLSPDDLPRLARLGVVASMQPLHCTSDIDIVRRCWGENRGLAYAWKSVRDAGVSLAFGSDAPVEVPDPLAGIFAATTRQRPDGYPEGGWQPRERLSVHEAVWAYTMGSAYACGREASMGSVTPGKKADFTLLDLDIFSEGPSGVLQARVSGTMIDGSWVYGGPEGIR